MGIARELQVTEEKLEMVIAELDALQRAASSYCHFFEIIRSYSWLDKDEDTLETLAEKLLQIDGLALAGLNVRPFVRSFPPSKK